MNKELSIIQYLKENLGQGLLFETIWSTDTGMSIEEYNFRENNVIYLDNIMTCVNKNLNELGLPQLGKYQLYFLESEAVLVIIKLDEHNVFGMLVDLTLTKIGILLNIIIPDIIARWNEFHQ